MFKLLGSCLKVICLEIVAFTEFQSHYEHLNYLKTTLMIEEPYRNLKLCNVGEK